MRWAQWTVATEQTAAAATQVRAMAQPLPMMLAGMRMCSSRGPR